MEPAPTQTVTVRVKLGGTAMLGKDYSVDTHQITFRRGESDRYFKVRIIEDKIAESAEPETIAITLDHPKPNNHCGVGLSSLSTTIEVIDVDEAPAFAPVESPLMLAVAGYFEHQPVMLGGEAAHYSATGLPPGLQIDSKTGKISGSPTASGDFSKVVITATNIWGKVTSPALVFHVMEIDSKFTGQFVALYPDGRLDLTISKTGSISCNYTRGSRRYPGKGKLRLTDDGADCELGVPGIGWWIESIDRVTGDLQWGWKIMRGSHRLGRHHFSMDEPWDEYMPKGRGFGSITVDSQGTARVVGKLAGNKSFTTSTPISADGRVLVYQALYKSGEGLTAVLRIEGTAERKITGNFVLGDFG